jgi:hypothetical protein
MPDRSATPAAAKRVLSTRERLQQRIIARRPAAAAAAAAAPRPQTQQQQQPQPQVIGLTDHAPAAAAAAPPASGLDRQSITEAIAEAKTRNLDFDATERSMTVKQNILTMVEMIRAGQTEEQIRKELAPFVEKYPELFKKVLSNDDLTPLQNMINLMDRMAAGSLSQHDASVIVGQGLAKAYIPKDL